MTNHEDQLKALEESNEPEGIVVRSADGRLFFLTKEDAERTAIPESRLYTAFRSLKDHNPHTTDRSVEKTCQQTWTWLETHKPTSALWRRRCLSYFEVCV